MIEPVHRGFETLMVGRGVQKRSERLVVRVCVGQEGGFENMSFGLGQQTHRRLGVRVPGTSLKAAIAPRQMLKSKAFYYGSLDGTLMAVSVTSGGASLTNQRTNSAVSISPGRRHNRSFLRRHAERPALSAERNCRGRRQGSVVSRADCATTACGRAETALHSCATSLRTCRARTSLIRV
jgi:hypothetical protein